MMSSEEVQRDKKTTDRVLIQLLIVQNLECINMDVSSGYDQISRQVCARVPTFLS